MGGEAIGKGDRGKISDIGGGLGYGDSKNRTSSKNVTSAETR